ncbi:PepSY-like domain-containing protein [Flavobacterium sp. 3HN19-14]|uniref:PepSY-like domain-containing protein n=1 Tax=Flavobacterium sp. 3HN19-14 TaxID=3448133 RepID=UPI003EE276DE
MEKEKNGDYEGEFQLKGKDASATFDTTGHLKELEVEIKTNELPKAALDYLKQNYPNEKIKEAAQITNDKGVVTYEAEIKKNGKSADIIFDANGKFIR